MHTGKFTVSESLAERQVVHLRRAISILALLCVVGANTAIADGFWGVSYGPFRDGQSPERGVFPSLPEVSEDIEIAAGLAEGLWFYSSARDTGFDAFVRQASQHPAGLKIVATAFLHNPVASWAEVVNSAELQGLMHLLADPDVALFSASVGSETLRRRDLPLDALIARIRMIRAANPRSIPITTSEPAHIWLENPELADEVDLIATTIYPFWGGIPIEAAADAAIDQVNALIRRFPGKLVIISETGWPSTGQPNGDAIPSLENATRYCREVRSHARAAGISMFHFAFADELWKPDASGLGVEQHFGILTSAREMKYSCN